MVGTVEGKPHSEGYRQGHQGMLPLEAVFLRKVAGTVEGEPHSEGYRQGNQRMLPL